MSWQMGVSVNGATPLPLDALVENPSTNGWWLGPGVPLWLRKPPNQCSIIFGGYYQPFPQPSSLAFNRWSTFEGTSLPALHSKVGSISRGLISGAGKKYPNTASPPDFPRDAGIGHGDAWDHHEAYLHLTQQSTPSFHHFWFTIHLRVPPSMETPIYWLYGTIDVVCLYLPWNLRVAVNTYLFLYIYWDLLGDVTLGQYITYPYPRSPIYIPL